MEMILLTKLEKPGVQFLDEATVELSAPLKCEMPVDTWREDFEKDIVHLLGKPLVVRISPREEQGDLFKKDPEAIIRELEEQNARLRDTLDRERNPRPSVCLYRAMTGGGIEARSFDAGETPEGWFPTMDGAKLAAVEVHGRSEEPQESQGEDFPASPDWLPVVGETVLYDGVEVQVVEIDEKAGQARILLQGEKRQTRRWKSFEELSQRKAEAA